jgi:TRAP-type mannitol/chloroaromatic compound transport system permease large subunit
MGTAALVVGVVALVLAALLIFFPIAFILGILAVIFGIVGMRRADRGEANNRNHALSGLICGALAFVLAVSIGIRLGTFINDHTGDFRDFWTCITSAPTESEQQACGESLARRLDEG